MDSRKVIPATWAALMMSISKNYLNSSPIAFVTRNGVPTLMVHEQQDVLVAYEHSIQLRTKTS